MTSPKKPQLPVPDFAAAPPPQSPESTLLEKWNIFDKAANKDIKWWFFALLMIGMGYTAFERWEAAEYNKQLRQEITDVRKDQMAFMTAKNEAMMTALMNNTKALESNTQILLRVEMRKNNE